MKINVLYRINFLIFVVINKFGLGFKKKGKKKKGKLGKVFN